MTEETEGKKPGTDDIHNGSSNNGILVPLKTTLETRARDSFISVYITSVPVKQASRTLEIIRRFLPSDGGVDLQHLRRFAKIKDVPHIVREAFERARGDVFDARGWNGVSEGRTRNMEEFDPAEEGRMAISEALEFVDVPKRAGDGLDVSGKDVAANLNGIPSENSDIARMSLVAASEDANSRSASPSAQCNEMANSDEQESKFSISSTSINAPIISNTDTASASVKSNSRTILDDLASKKLFLIIGSTNAISHTAAVGELSAAVSNAVIFSIQVPRLAPTSPEQAASWSSKYWPTVYKKSNPFGPHPSIVSRAEQEIQGDILKWMDLASEVARQADITGSGEAVGVVIVERKDAVARPVAITGDARWVGWPRGGPGNVTAHAVLRAIAMVAARLKSTDEAEQPANTVSASLQLDVEPIPVEQMIRDEAVHGPKDSSQATWNTKLGTSDTFMHAGQEKQADAADIFQEEPFLATEKNFYDLSGTEAGYLCNDLEIYCTHEPCVMCSMAIVHSRFGKAIFQHRMPKTGGMCADSDLGHGLFWRKELNWTLLAWQWLPSRDGQKMRLPEFHA